MHAVGAIIDILATIVALDVLIHFACLISHLTLLFFLPASSVSPH